MTLNLYVSVQLNGDSFNRASSVVLPFNNASTSAFLLIGENWMSQGCPVCSLVMFLWLSDPRTISLYRPGPGAVHTSTAKIASETISQSLWTALGRI